MDFDVLVIGGGPGGYVAAIRAAQLGAATALVEKADLGGTCLNRGCIPTKVLLGAAEKVAGLQAAKEFGITVSSVCVDFPKMMAKKDHIVGQLRNGVRYLLEQRAVKIYQGSARFLDKHVVQISYDGKSERISARKVIIATGSVPSVVEIPGKSGRILNSDGILALQEIPRELVVVGGGVIGIELATLFSNLGTKVTIVEAMKSILSGMDTEVAMLLARQLKRKGIKIFTGATVRECRPGSESDVCVVSTGGDKTLEIGADRILVAAGRRACTEGLDPGAAGVAFTAGGITVSSDHLTNVSHIYAIGDVAGGPQLAHLASSQGIRAAEHAVKGRSTFPLDCVPACLYTQPEAAAAGLTEERLKGAGVDFKVAKFPLRANGKAYAMGGQDGFVKILYGPKHGELLGVHMVGPHATEIIGEAVLAMRSELTVDEVATTIHAHPTVSEAFMEAAEAARGTPIHLA